MRTVRDTSGEWEVPFYRALLGADGVILVGGGQSTRITGILAMAQDVPILPVAAFGGGAEQVWTNLDKVRNHATDEDMRLMGAPWSPESATDLVATLVRHADERDARARGERTRARLHRWAEACVILAAGLLLAAALSAIPLVGGPAPASATSLAALLVAPMSAAVSGALIRNSFGEGGSWLHAGVRGLGAGTVSVLLYVAAQLLTVPDLLDMLDARRLLFFVIPLGFSAGFTFDLVLERLRGEGQRIPAAGAAPDDGPGTASSAT
ncbi:hypothetical protein BJF83_08780 [Nocardiopsis sp. CNR-923]|uniref:hypothetical protein n=1 Tax=Nocardiopsis sp. CNR-923 TaxID=1904965 RepID=UPI00095DE1B0|nr:hypothetical protein [Nocardiopsis sp. CNR-923]OLT30374.1 hypothetical protein BJF83_08780 [Nocardiopsis sp. CNR-923]